MFSQDFSLIDKIPASIDLEFSVLSHLYWDGDVFSNLKNIINSSDFFKPEHVKLFHVMEQCFLKDGIITKHSINDFLNSDDLLNKIGGSEFLNKLEIFVPDFQNTITFAKKIKEKSIKRKQMILAVEYISKLKKDDYDVQNELDSILFKLKNLSNNINQTNIYEDITAINKRLLNELSSTKDLGIHFGFPIIDSILGGLRPKTLNVLGAETSFGKTTFALNVAYNMAQNGYKVAYLTLEMTKEELAIKINSRFSGLSYMQFLTRDLNYENWQHLDNFHETKIKNTKLLIADAPLDINEIASTTRTLKQDLNIDILIIDHLHYIKSKKYQDNKNLEIGTYTHTLKELAKELNLPILLLSQVNRSNTMRADKRPNKNDLRDSGTIAQDCDTLAFLFKESSYNKDFEFPNQVEFIIRKNRGGETNIAIYLELDGKISLFTEKNITPERV